MVDQSTYALMIGDAQVGLCETERGFVGVSGPAGNFPLAFSDIPGK
jgi:hypothetical protein